MSGGARGAPHPLVQNRGGSTVKHRGPPTPMTSVEPAIPSVFSPCWTPVKLNIDPNNYAAQCKGQQAANAKAQYEYIDGHRVANKQQKRRS